eukprot:scaffold4314_cov90-Isochrysis_galbana.AAC.2
MASGEGKHSLSECLHLIGAARVVAKFQDPASPWPRKVCRQPAATVRVGTGEWEEGVRGRRGGGEGGWSEGG